jgi:hypothetical protein
MSSQKDYSPSSPAAVNDREARMMTTERDQHVIVVPDSMRTDPVETEWMNESRASLCRIMVLGQRIAYVHYSGVSNARYLELLLKMIAAGVKVIHQVSLAETNAKYLEIYPDAEGSRIRRAKPLNLWAAPFEINVPANTVCTMDIAWPHDAKQVLAGIDPIHDEGQAWGIGLALGWPDGQYVQINARTDGYWGIRRNGHEYLCGSCPKGKPAIVMIVLDHKRVQLEAQAKEHQYVAEFPRNEFPRVPAIVRVGKIGRTWEPLNSEDIGPTSPCRVNWVKIY